MTKAFGTLLLVVTGIAFLLFVGSVDACPDRLRCSNFTDSEKRADCNYVRSQGFSRAEQQQIYCRIWDDSYEFEEYHPPQHPLDIQINTDYNLVENERFVMAFKFFIFGVINYIIFSLSKSSLLIKWLTAI